MILSKTCIYFVKYTFPFVNNIVPKITLWAKNDAKQNQAP
jgi:hypothetical protein